MKELKPEQQSEIILWDWLMTKKSCWGQRFLEL